MSARFARRLGSALSVLIVWSAMFALAPAAWAAAPSNDNRADAIRVHPPQSLTATLVDATLEATHDFSECAGTDSSVWYHFTAPDRGAIVVQLDAGGEMDATVDLFKQVRSKLTWVDCGATDSDGQATLDDDRLTPGAATRSASPTRAARSPTRSSCGSWSRPHPHNRPVGICPTRASGTMWTGS